jgi:crossover junction endodeoxyribonuclease RusA
MTPYRIELAWPPTVNHYWVRTRKGGMCLTAKAKMYRQSVAIAVLTSGSRRNLRGELAVSITATPPDLKCRDLDNLLKAVLDGLAKAGVYEDDFQIARLSIERVKPSKPGKLVIEITEVD